MSEQAFFWIAGIFAAAVCALGGALWKHLVDDAKVRERVATLEADNTQTKNEVAGLRKDRHDFHDELKRSTWELIQARYEKIEAWMAAFKSEVLRLIGK